MRGSAMSSTRLAAHLLVRAATLTLVFGILALPTGAQTNKADIVGTVTDSKGGGVQGATVKVTKVDTSATRGGKSNDNGEHHAPSLEIGSYKITAPELGVQTAVE